VIKKKKRRGRTEEEVKELTILLHIKVSFVVERRS
jgi:hypothetical protein